MSDYTSSASDIEIQNMVLRLCQVTKSITSDDDTTTFSRLFPTVFPDWKKTLLATNAWNFAEEYVQLSKLEETPLDQRYEYAFALPSDYVKIITIMDKNSGIILRDSYRIKDESQLLCNWDEIIIRYVRNIKTEYMPSYFRRLLALFLAQQFAQIFTGEGSDEDRLTKKFQDAYNRAVLIDGQDNPAVQLIPESDILNSRDDDHFDGRFSRDSLYF